MKTFKNIHYRKSRMKVRLEEIESEILSIGRTIDLDKEGKKSWPIFIMHSLKKINCGDRNLELSS